MFQVLKPQPDDPLLSLIKAFHNDPRPEKIDLGVGVYRDDTGETPVMEAIKQAEGLLLEGQKTKAYLGPAGDKGFVEAIAGLVSGPGAKVRAWTGLQTPGGTGALRLALQLVHQAAPQASVWLGAPSWPIHAFILDDVRQRARSYPHVDPATGDFNLGAALEAISKARAGDVFLLHGCCHNPTGVDPTPQDWAAVSAALKAQGVLPLIDLAYHGLGDGPENDLVGVRAILADHDRLLIAYSCDKNFGLYRERTGALLAFGADAAETDVLHSNLAGAARVLWSMPPDHGAAAVRVVMEMQDLAALWRRELNAMAARLKDVRMQLAQAGTISGVDLSAIAKQRGMFSVLPLTPAQIMRLREERGIYMAGSGRINVAGFCEGQVGLFLNALKQCL